MSEWITCGKPGVVVCRVKNDVDDGGNPITRFRCDEIADVLRGENGSVESFRASNGWRVGSCDSPEIDADATFVWLRGVCDTEDSYEDQADGHHAEAIAQAVNEAAEAWAKKLGVATQPAIDWEQRRWDLASGIFRDAMNKPLGEVDDAMGAVCIAATGSVRLADALIAAFRGDKHDA